MAFGEGFSPMTPAEMEQKHAIDVQLLAIRCGALYGALVFGGLVAVHIALTQSTLGAVLAIAGAGLAYANFSLVASSARALFVGIAMAGSIACGLMSGLILLGL